MIQTRLDDRPILSVIVPVYRDWKSLKHCITCLHDQTVDQQTYEILVVNNDPCDSMPSGFFIPENCRTLVEAKPGSYSARNKGVASSYGDILCFTDADCRPDSLWLKSILEEFQRHGNQFLLSGRVEMFQASSEHKLNCAESYDMALGINQHLYWRRGVAATANLSVPRLVFEDVGGFDSRLLSGGDGDFCKRAKKKGYPLRYSEVAVVRHPLRVTISQISLKRRRLIAGRLNKSTLLIALLAFTPPLDRIDTIIRSAQPVELKLKALLVVLWLKAVDIRELFRLLLCNGKPERR